MKYPMGFPLGGILGLPHSFSRGTPWCTKGASDHRRSLDVDFGWYTFSPSFLDAVIPMSKNAIKCFAEQYILLSQEPKIFRTHGLILAYEVCQGETMYALPPSTCPTNARKAWTSRSTFRVYRVSLRRLYLVLIIRPGCHVIECSIHVEGPTARYLLADIYYASADYTAVAQRLIDYINDERRTFCPTILVGPNDLHVMPTSSQRCEDPSIVGSVDTTYTHTLSYP